MADLFRNTGGALEIRYNGEIIRIEAAGPDALRVRARPGNAIIETPVSALLLQTGPAGTVTIAEREARIANGKITASVRMVNRHGADVKREPVLRFMRSDIDAVLTEEVRSHFAGPGPRAYRPLAGQSFKLEQTFAAFEGERFFGSGQPQHGRLDLKGVSSTLLQQNSHVTVPFILSSRGYGFLWNNPATGRLDLAANLTRWSADATQQLDYWIVAGDTPRDILRRYIDATGHAPDCPEWVTGFWQCKLRYRTQDELLEAARAYKARGLPLACIVIDFFHWTRMGEWAFDAAEWPDPDAMMRELREMGVETMVSIWPTVNQNATTWTELRERGFLMKTERGSPMVTAYPDKHPLAIHAATYYDAFNPEARAFLFDRVREHYLRHGIVNFWLDSCEPEIRPNHPEHVRLMAGNGAEVLNAYPEQHIKGFREGLTAAGRPDGVLLVRSAWAGSQRHGIILWSGDVRSSWRDFRAQIAAGLNSGLSGIAWWTTDIGGFFDGHGGDPDFRELLVRWFQFGVFSPICRLHGFRVPENQPIIRDDTLNAYGTDTFHLFTNTGGGNEVWSYGEEVYRILTALMALRERLRPYVGRLMRAHSETGDPLMRPLFYDFPEDPRCWSVDDSYLFGPDLLVAPVTEPGARSRSVYLPMGAEWIGLYDGAVHAGGRTVEADAPLDRIPVFRRAGAPDPLSS